MLPKHARRVETERETRAPAIGGRITTRVYAATGDTTITDPNTTKRTQTTSRGLKRGYIFNIHFTVDGTKNATRLLCIFFSFFTSADKNNNTAPKATSRITNRRVPFFHLACRYCLPTQLTKMSH